MGIDGARIGNGSLGGSPAGTVSTRANARRPARRGHHEITDVVSPTATRIAPRWSRRRGVVAVFASFAALGFAGAYVGPAGVALAEPRGGSAPRDEVLSFYADALPDAQSFSSTEGVAEPAALGRAGYTVYVTPKPTPTPTARASSEPSVSGPGVAAPIRPAYSGGGSPAEWMSAAGIAESDWGFVDYIVKRESSWNPNATNPSSGACGLVQALPCSKVPGNGYDPVDNLRWASGYATGRYGSWASAYDFWTRNHWW